VKKAHLKSLLQSQTEVIGVRDLIEALKEEGIDNPFPLCSA